MTFILPFVPLSFNFSYQNRSESPAMRNKSPYARRQSYAGGSSTSTAPNFLSIVQRFVSNSPNEFLGKIHHKIFEKSKQNKVWENPLMEIHTNCENFQFCFDCLFLSAAHLCIRCTSTKKAKRELIDKLNRRTKCVMTSRF